MRVWTSRPLASSGICGGSSFGISLFETAAEVEGVAASMRPRGMSRSGFLGNQTYESLARKGEAMAISAMVTYAYDQIDQARTELNAVPE